MPQWKMTPENRRIAERVKDGESPTKIAREIGKTRVRIYQIFHSYCKRYLFFYEYADAMESPRPMDKLRYYLKAQNV